MGENKNGDNDVQKGLEKFDKELDKYLAIKQKIETAFHIQNETVRNEDRALQIRLAQLNADLQYLLAGFFGFLAVGVSFAVFGLQIFLDQIPNYPKLDTIQTVYSIAVLTVSILSFVGVFVLRPKLQACLNNFKNLQKKP